MLGKSLVILALTALCCTGELAGAMHPKSRAPATLLTEQDSDQDLLSSSGPGGLRVRRQSRPIFHNHGMRQLLSALGEMNRAVRSLEDKLMRHESREAQMADFTSKTLNSLVADHSQTTDTLTQTARQMAVVEERVMAVLTLVRTSDERQRSMLTKLSEGLDRLLMSAAEPSLGRAPFDMPEMPREIAVPSSAEVEKDVKTILRKMAELEGSQDTQLRDVSTQVRQLNDDLSQQFGQVTTRQDGILSAVLACQQNENEISPNEECESCKKLETEMVGRLELLTQMQQNQDMMIQDLKQNTLTALGQQETGLHAVLHEIRQDEAAANGSFSAVLDGLRSLEEASRENLGTLHTNLKMAVDENSAILQEKVNAMSLKVEEGQSNIMGALDDTASMTDNLQSTVADNYDLLSREISGLNKVEQVMINTADAVLDTKRSIEFGIQQVILELSEIVSKSGSTINSTLSDQINSISFNILKNQTSALTNMTKRMEDEISQVWRQIGIMYQQVEQSVNMLDDLKDTTSQHMNVSLSRAGTVGEINGKVGDVGDNLNYLLGRLSLVVSEFNHMKAGIGNELEKLREMATQEISIPNGNQDSLKYNINRKRHIPEGYYERD
ncbi:hypothetical protein FHG87_006293 [Trinorchestia longiramus]|nr:hypothetical protein FHG87_006293 [Trinorchestia longiramus]